MRRSEPTAGLWCLSISDFVESLDLSNLSRSCVGYGNRVLVTTVTPLGKDGGKENKEMIMK